VYEAPAGALRSPKSLQVLEWRENASGAGTTQKDLPCVRGNEELAGSLRGVRILFQDICFLLQWFFLWFSQSYILIISNIWQYSS